MNMTKEMLEVLIGKYLDAEITPGEQRLLDTALDSDVQAKELLQELQYLQERSREAVVSTIWEQGRLAEEVFERAWQQQSKRPARRITRTGHFWRFAVGLAAGLAIGLALHFALSARRTPQPNQTQPNLIAENTDITSGKQQPSLLLPVFDPVENVTRNVDWYSFTDKHGDQWLIEGFRENKVRPAVYHGDL